MAEKLTIGGVEITVVGGDCDREGRTVFTYTLKGAGIDHEASDLKSGCGSNGREDRDGMTSLLSFLGAAVESYRYGGLCWKADTNCELFPPAVVEWAYQHDGEISMAAYEYENPCA